MRFVLLVIAIIFVFGCQRDKNNEVGLSYNKTLLIPPSNDLPIPGSDIVITNSNTSSSPLVQSILEKTNANNVDKNIAKQVDDEYGVNTDENFFQWLFKGKSKR